MTKIFNIICTLILHALLSNLPVHAQVTNNLPATEASLPNWTKSVVKIWYECNGNIYTGTGVIISKSGYIITAAHVGRNCDNTAGTKIKIGLVESTYTVPQQKFTAKQMYTVTDNVGNPNVYDLKLLKIDNLNGTELNPAVFSSALPFAGDEILVAGFPDLPFIFLNSQKQAPLSVFKTSVLSCFAESNNGIPTRIHYGGNSLPGFSGGPIFDKNGKLIGIHSTRSTANISNLLNTNCTDTSDKPCFGNAIRFPVLTTGNILTTQVINLDYNALKTVLDNYSWGTSIWRIPQEWITLIQN